MKRLKTLLGMAIVVGFCALLPSVAMAADAAFEIEVQGIISTVVGGIFAAFGAVITWAIHKLSNVAEQKFSVDIEDSMRQYLNEAAISGLNIARAAVLDKTKTIENPDVQNEILAKAANYVMARVPDALSYFDLVTDAQIREFVAARLPKLET